MNKKQSGLTLILAMLAGLAGGTVSNRFLTVFPLSPQKALQQVEILHAERVEITDKEGRRRAWFGLSPKGNVGLGLYDQDGQISVALSVTPDRTTGLMFADKDGTRRAGLLLSADNEPALELYDKDKKCPSGLLWLLMESHNCGCTIHTSIRVS